MPLDPRIQFIREARKESATFDEFFRAHYIWFDLTLGKPGTCDAVLDLAEAATTQYHQEECLNCHRYFNLWDVMYYRDVDDAPRTIEKDPLCGECADRLWE